MESEYRLWEKSVPAAITGDVLWKVQAYRLALFAADIAWPDAVKLARGVGGRMLADQLYRVVGSISANIAEGYSRGTGRDRAHFYEYALGSARESRDWYFKSRHALGEETVELRLSLLAQIIRLLLTMVPDQRSHSLREESPAYGADDTQAP